MKNRAWVRGDFISLTGLYLKEESMQKCFKSSQGLPLVWFSLGSLESWMCLEGSVFLQSLGQYMSWSLSIARTSSAHKVKILPCQGRLWLLAIPHTPWVWEKSALLGCVPQDPSYPSSSTEQWAVNMCPVLSQAPAENHLGRRGYLGRSSSRNSVRAKASTHWCLFSRLGNQN